MTRRDLLKLPAGLAVTPVATQSEYLHTPYTVGFFTNKIEPQNLDTEAVGRFLVLMRDEQDRVHQQVHRRLFSALADSEHYDPT